MRLRASYYITIKSRDVFRDPVCCHRPSYNRLANSILILLVNLTVTRLVNLTVTELVNLIAIWLVNLMVTWPPI